MYASLSSENASHINFIKIPVLCFEATESDARKSICLNFKLWNKKPAAANCTASVSCYSKLQTLELCCYKGSTTSVRYMEQLAMHWKKSSCPKYWTYWTWELHHWRSIWYYLRSKCQGQLCCTNVWHPGKTHGAVKSQVVFGECSAYMHAKIRLLGHIWIS